jgi:hypothetical protein
MNRTLSKKNMGKLNEIQETNYAVGTSHSKSFYQSMNVHRSQCHQNISSIKSQQQTKWNRHNKRHYKDVRFGLVSGFIGHTILNYYNSLQHYCQFTQSAVHYTRTESSRSVVLHQPSGTSFQRRAFDFLGPWTVPVTQPQQLLTHSALEWNFLILVSLHTYIFTLLELF